MMLTFLYLCAMLVWAISAEYPDSWKLFFSLSRLCFKVWCFIIDMAMFIFMMFWVVMIPSFMWFGFRYVKQSFYLYCLVVVTRMIPFPLWKFRFFKYAMLGLYIFVLESFWLF